MLLSHRPETLDVVSFGYDRRTVESTRPGTHEDTLNLAKTTWAALKAIPPKRLYISARVLDHPGEAAVEITPDAGGLGTNGVKDFTVGIVDEEEKLEEAEVVIKEEEEEIAVPMPLRALPFDTQLGTTSHSRAPPLVTNEIKEFTVGMVDEEVKCEEAEAVKTEEEEDLVVPMPRKPLWSLPSDTQPGVAGHSRALPLVTNRFKKFTEDLAVPMALKTLRSSPFDTQPPRAGHSRAPPLVTNRFKEFNEDLAVPMHLKPLWSPPFDTQPRRAGHSRAAPLLTNWFK
ncbi:hypothetical protein FS837_001392 [Tulasnella sp. UAMH 9824]|nr:hypothetical protein FS837_001392 [Tulasnella sp. UAMH 9824]